MWIALTQSARGLLTSEFDVYSRSPHRKSELFFSFSAGIDCIRQILTFKVPPRAKRVKVKVYTQEAV